MTTIIKELGFIVDGIDLLPAPYIYEGVNYLKNDFLIKDYKDSFYDVVILCSTLEHIGLKGRYGSQNIIDGDFKTIKKIKLLLKSGGLIILTIPYGQEKIIKSLHRVYNKNSKLLKYIYENFDVIIEEFYKKNQKDIWINCNENEAKLVIPSKDNYALGLFVFKKRKV